jgi:LAO/AO transport system kinase
MWSHLINHITTQEVKSLARAISLIENEVEGYQDFLQQLPAGKTPVTGITGPPGAGKSTLVDALIGTWVAEGKKVAVLSV